MDKAQIEGNGVQPTLKAEQKTSNYKQIKANQICFHT